MSATPAPKPAAVTVPDLLRKKARGERIAMLTAYDFPTARLVDQSGADVVLVGNSLGMEELGFDTTLPVTLDIMLHHARAVRRGTERALLLVDMPFGSYQITADDGVRSAVRLMQEGGAHAVKLEGGTAIAPTLRRIVDAGIPVCGHIGFTPQSVHQLGIRLQGKDEEGARRVLADARAVQDAGAFAVVLELLPPALAAQITAELTIPTVGIGAGPQCDGQVLVTSDLLDVRASPPLRHVRQYAHIGETILTALQSYCRDVRDGTFPP